MANFENNMLNMKKIKIISLCISNKLEDYKNDENIEIHETSLKCELNVDNFLKKTKDIYKDFSVKKDYDEAIAQILKIMYDDLCQESITLQKSYNSIIMEIKTKTDNYKKCISIPTLNTIELYSISKNGIYEFYKILEKEIIISFFIYIYITRGLRYYLYN